MLRWLNAFTACAAFLGAAAFVRSLVPWPEELGLRAKLDWFEQHADEFDVLFIGSSRVFRDIVPREFDATLAERGIALRSFNLGIGGMRELEADNVLRWALALEPVRLRWVIVEAGRWDPRPDEIAELLTRREVAWHDLKGTRNAIEAAFALDLPASERVREVWRHVRLFGTRCASLGQGPAIAGLGAELSAPDSRRLAPDELERERGWQAMGAEEARMDTVEWKALVERARLAEERGTSPGPDALEHFPERAVLRQLERIERSGARGVYASLPSSEGSVFARAAHALGLLPRYLAYDLPSRYPRLYAPELRADTNHLNAQGAQLFTRLLAADFAQLIAE